jgi:hypothetical protein
VNKTWFPTVVERRAAKVPHHDSAKISEHQRQVKVRRCLPEGLDEPTHGLNTVYLGMKARERRNRRRFEKGHEPFLEACWHR